MQSEIRNPLALSSRQKAWRQSATAFTLVELLVVVAIIAILLAMLVPAINGAVYQAELTTCAAKIRAVGAAATTAAVANKRYYPSNPYNTSYTIRDGGEGFRPVLRAMLAINPSLNDPLTSKPVDLDGSVAPSIASSYQMWFGWGYTVGGDRKMTKLGDRWTFTSPVAGSEPRSFSLIASDYVGGTLVSGLTSPSGATLPLHQDRANSMWADYSENDRVANWTYSRWQGNYNALTEWDFNYGYSDGSVRRLNRITIDGADDRMASVSVYNTKELNEMDFGWYLPKE